MFAVVYTGYMLMPHMRIVSSKLQNVCFSNIFSMEGNLHGTTPHTANILQQNVAANAAGVVLGQLRHPVGIL